MNHEISDCTSPPIHRSETQNASERRAGWFTYAAGPSFHTCANVIQIRTSRTRRRSRPIELRPERFENGPAPTSALTPAASRPTPGQTSAGPQSPPPRVRISLNPTGSKTQATTERLPQNRLSLATRIHGVLPRYDSQPPDPLMTQAPHRGPGPTSSISEAFVVSGLQSYQYKLPISTKPTKSCRPDRNKSARSKSAKSFRDPNIPLDLLLHLRFPSRQSNAAQIDFAARALDQPPQRCPRSRRALQAHSPRAPRSH